MGRLYEDNGNCQVVTHWEACALDPHELSLTGCSQVDILSVRYTFVNFRMKTIPVAPNTRDQIRLSGHLAAAAAFGKRSIYFDHYGKHCN